VDFGLAPGQSLHAVLRTSLGAIDCTLNVDEAPVSVRIFVDLARGLRPWVDPRTGAEVLRPLYDGTVFHRVIPGFLIQGGDPTGTGAGGPGFSIPDEIGAERQFDRPGLLALANRGPNTNGSQFFVTDGPAHHLDGRYTRLGTCTNLDVVAAIARVPRGERNRPVSPPVLRAVEIAAR
jgi:peptidyl-prolyl cis-trans isomerase A (cyclophilin A)